MTLEEAYNFSSPNQCLARDMWIKDGIIMHLISADKTLDEIKLSLDSNAESLEADDWNIYLIVQ
jgi:hypothetical protein